MIRSIKRSKPTVMQREVLEVGMLEATGPLARNEECTLGQFDLGERRLLISAGSLDDTA